MKGHVIREVKKVKYLGVILDNNFKSDSHIVSKMAQGIKAKY